MPFTRDPVSVWFDAAAARFVTRAYEARGEWAGVYLAPPTAMQRGHLALLGVLDPYELDRWGEVRWVRAFKRSCFHTLSWYGGVSGLRTDGAGELIRNSGAGVGGWHAPVRGQWETGARIRKAGWPNRRWAIRMRIHPGGAATSRIGKRLPAGKRWIDDEGHATDRRSSWEDQTWQ